MLHYHNKTFRAVSVSNNGEASGAIAFNYQQKGEIVTCSSVTRVATSKKGTCWLWSCPMEASICATTKSMSEANFAAELATLRPKY